MGSLFALTRLYLPLYGRIILFMVVVSLTLLGMDLGQSWTAHDARLREARIETENLARSLARHAQDVFETSDALVKGLRDSLDHDGTGSSAIALLEYRMGVQIRNQKSIQSMFAYDERGNWLASSRPAPDLSTLRSLNYSERDFFRFHRDHDSDVVLIGTPIHAKFDGALVVTITRRLNHSDGSFAGVAGASISVDLFQRFFKTFDIGVRGAITLATGQGAIIVRRPFDENDVGRSFAQTQFFLKIQDYTDAGSFAFTSLLSREPRLGSFHRVPGFDLVMMVALSKDEVLADWWHETKVHLVWLAIMILFVAILGHRLAVQMRNRIAAESTAQKLRLEVAQLAVNEAEHLAHDRELERANADLKNLSSDLAHARDAADRANRAKSRFLAGMTHELRTPLNGILGYAHLLHIGGGLNATQGLQVNAMLQSGKHLLELITCVLDLSEIENEHAKLQAIKLNVLALTTACLDVVRPTAELKGLALQIAMAPDAPQGLVADPPRLRQILVNLLGNAVKFTSLGIVQLRVLLAASGSAVRFEVADTGPGISAEHGRYLFQDFERLDAEATRTVEGAGLGLAISGRLAILMGGRIGHADNPGGGSVFWLELPLDTTAVSSPATASAVDLAEVEPVLAPARPLHVLVVDDVLMNRDIASSFLRLFGHQVTCVEGGAEAVAAVAATAFDVVLMDVRMPEMDGLEATRRIRANEGTDRRVPIIALTAQAFTEQVAECLKAGMDSHIGKPFDPDTLLASVVRAAGTEPSPARQLNSTSTPDIVIPVAAVPVIGSELLVWDRKAFERTAGFLTPLAVAAYLQTITEMGEALFLGLRKPDALMRTDDELAEAAHKIAGSAGMLGFDRLASLGRRFERAVKSGAADAPALCDSLAAAIEASLRSIRDHMWVPVVS